MLKIIISCLFASCFTIVFGQELIPVKKWQFRQAATGRWYAAAVPGAVHEDLYRNRLVKDPFYAENEAGLQWIDTVDWEYRSSFVLTKEWLGHKPAILVFEGLDSYADVYLNNKIVLKADNMFTRWEISLTDQAKAGKNTIRVYFHSAKRRVDSLAAANLPLILPDNNRVYARKAQYQFGWDWGPKFIGAGIWKPVYLTNAEAVQRKAAANNSAFDQVKLQQKKDSIGTSFYFEKAGKPFYVKGANWIPAHAFPAVATKHDYRQLLIMAKEAGINMLRVWGGGIYEQDFFYQLCDSLGIMLWQDFMFAGGMYPGDQQFFGSVKAEVKSQLERLSNYSCIVLWCGNNEVDEAWHHWGWQQQFNLHGSDSARVWNNYERLFKDSLPAWVKLFDKRQRPYVSTSPQYGWGNPLSYKNGDSHYWGLWWGLEGWEKFKTHTGRFVSEWGMQAMPDYSTVKKYTPPTQRYINSPAVNAHQKASDGFKKLNHYVHQYFFDTSKLKRLSLEEYGYLTQCVQYYVLKNSLATQMNQQPINMGTLVWQLNDCWPVTSWSIIDFYKKPKAGYYAVKKAFLGNNMATDAVYPRSFLLQKPRLTITLLNSNSIKVESNIAAKYICVSLGNADGYLSDNYFDLKAGEAVVLTYSGTQPLAKHWKEVKLLSLADILLK
ncbi:MAG: glycoside hydrolase family 2 protein [Chitinophagaceae bacterium]|nr:MAG: glycoside hydrolase family 2 protein [Chitinophagaceae bacterium]